MYLQSLKLLQPMVKEMHLQENYLFDLWVRYTQNVAQYPLHHVIYSVKKFEVATSNGLGEIHLQEKHCLTLTLGVKVTRNVAQYPLHHMTYSATKFEVAMSNGLGGDTFTRNMTDRRTDRQRDGRMTDQLW